MTERVRSRSGAPTPWAGPVLDDADPMGGRHVLDQDAGLTPIFTTLRRGAWRRPRPQPGRRALRPVPDLVPLSPGDPWTAPIPVVTALPVVEPPHGTGGYGPIDAYAATTISAVEPPVSPNEATAWWGLPVVAGAGDGHGAYDRGGYDPDPYDSHSYDADSYSDPHGSSPYAAAYTGAAPRSSAAYEPASYDSGSYESAAYDSAAYDSAAYDSGSYGSHDPAAYDSGSYGSYGSASYEPDGYGSGS
ncbi:MAG: hypothetical protein QOK35_461, partial [Pseudonocardiales bacterium]|nr:hypothetical protein [Pseudonocardiales bacterium]